MEQYIYKVTCRVTGCPNSFLEVDVISETLPENVTCGPCGNQITDIQDTGIIFSEDQNYSS